ncbi:MAG: sugar-binding transcriptional regulator [Lactovum sp.]
MINNQELLAHIAQDYYLSQLSLNDLVKKYNLSRYLINKYLEDAKNEGIVSITITSPIDRSFELEKQFKQLFNIPHIYIVKDNEEDNNKALIKFASERVQSRIINSQIVGTLWGETIYRVVENFTTQELKNLIVTQVMGENRKYHSLAGSMRMVEKVAKKFSAEYVTLSGPLYIINPTTRQGMMNEPSSQPALSTAQKTDLIFTSLGTLSSINSIPTWKQEIINIFPNINLGAVAGVIYGRPYDIEGNLLIKAEEDCVFGVDLKTILQTPNRVGIVKSKFKTRATLGALRGQFFTELIISESVAYRILAEL